MKDGDKVVLTYNIMKLTRKYWPLDKVADRLRVGRIADSCQCTEPKILFPAVYYTAELKWSEN